jgi:predicted enzyme related to lactoylglutathione lyase
MKVLGVDATYYWAKDLPRATAFYTSLIGSPPTGSMENVYSEWTFPNGESFGLYKGDPFVRCDGVMFAVEDVAATVAELKKLGLTVHGDVDETPVCFMGFAEDSEGNGFILHHRKSGGAGAN